MRTVRTCSSVSKDLLIVGTPKITFHIQRNPAWDNENKRRRLFLYKELPISRQLSSDSSRDIWNLLLYSKICICLFQDFSRNVQPCSAEPWLGNAGL
jgi:hypothetical protein